MSEHSKIEWTDHTFNPWIGCTKVGPGCDHCYAETLSKARLGVQWGPGVDRRRAAQSTWKQPRRWNYRAAKLGIRERVFCASLADVFDNAVPDEWRADLFQLVRETPHLDWLLLTKRIGNVLKMSGASAQLPDNVWLGATVVNQAEFDRDAAKLCDLKAAGVAERTFLSIEPMLGPIELHHHVLFQRCPNWFDEDGYPPCIQRDCGAQECCTHCDFTGIGNELGIDWIIVGGESGPHARPMHPDWARSLRDQCEGAGVPFLFKQWGEWAPAPHPEAVIAVRPERRDFMDSEGWENAMIRIGKRAAGRLLDGTQHDGMPS
ncbi:MAG: hypothetical protein C0494_17070 [Sphingobium sp.]|nr:hypothetical protein [Sphingobium sp.]